MMLLGRFVAQWFKACAALNAQYILDFQSNIFTSDYLKIKSTLKYSKYSLPHSPVSITEFVTNSQDTKYHTVLNSTAKSIPVPYGLSSKAAFQEHYTYSSQN